jgi:hypothetical protein
MKFEKEIKAFLIIDLVQIILISGIICFIKISQLGEVLSILFPLLGFSIIAFVFISIGLYYIYFSASRMKYEIFSMSLLIMSSILILVLLIDSRKNISNLLIIIPVFQFFLIGFFNLKYIWRLDYKKIKQDRINKIKQKNDAKIVI